MTVALMVRIVPGLIEALLKTTGRVDRQAPAVTESEAGTTISRPDRRLSPGIYFADGQPRPAIFLEREGTWAEATAQSIAEEVPANVEVIVRGTAQSIWPTYPVEVRQTDPIRPGASISHYEGRAGTLGCLVSFRTGQQSLRGFIGSAHVLGMLGTAAYGKEESADPIIRPGFPDGPKMAANRVGYLSNYAYLSHYRKRTRDVTTPNTEDVGMVLLDDHVQADDHNLVPSPSDGNILKKIVGVVSVVDLMTYTGADVYKIGRTSGLTKGIFSGIETTQCPIKLPDGQIYLYSNVLQVAADGRPFSEPGDSGALVYTADMKALGLIVGGNDNFSIVSPLFLCLKVMSAELVI